MESARSVFYLLSNLIVVVSAHKRTFHGQLTMSLTQLGSTYWIPILGILDKSLLNYSYLVIKFIATSFPDPKLGQLLWS